MPSAHAISALTGPDMHVRWGSNWDNELAGWPENASADPDAGLEDQVKLAFEQVFMFYLPPSTHVQSLADPATAWNPPPVPGARTTRSARR